MKKILVFLIVISMTGTQINAGSKNKDVDSKSNTIQASGVRLKKGKKKSLLPLYLGAGIAVIGVSAYFTLRKGEILNRGTAILHISSSPLDGDVFIDGEKRCSTPCTLKGIKPGKYKIKVERELYGKWEKEMVLEGWREYEIEAELSPFAYEMDRCFGGFGEEPGEFRFFSDLTLDKEGNIYVADWQNSRIQKFTPLGTFVYQRYIPYWPLGIRYNPFNDKIYVVGESPELMRFTLSLAHDWTKDLGLHNPSSLGADSQGRVYIADRMNDRIVVTNSEGNIVSVWKMKAGSNPEDAEPGDNGVVYVSTCKYYSDRILVYDYDGNQIGEFSKKINCTTTIALDRTGNVYVTGRTKNWRGGVYKFLPDGSFVQLIGKERLTSPVGIGVFQNGDLVVGEDPDICFWKITDRTINSPSAKITIKSQKKTQHYRYYGSTIKRSSAFSESFSKIHKRKHIRK